MASKILRKRDPVIVSGTLYRPLNELDLKRWARSDAAKGMTSAGETKIPPRSICRDVTDIFMEVERGRARYAVSYGPKTSGWTLVKDTEGVIWAVRTTQVESQRESLED